MLLLEGSSAFEETGKVLRDMSARSGKRVDKVTDSGARDASFEAIQQCGNAHIRVQNFMYALLRLRILGRGLMLRRCGNGAVDGRGQATIFCRRRHVIEVGIERFRALHGRNNGRGSHGV